MHASLLLLFSCSPALLMHLNSTIYICRSYTKLNSNFLRHIKVFSYFLRYVDSNYLQHGELSFRSLYVSSFRTFSDIQISNFFMYPRKLIPIVTNGNFCKRHYSNLLKCIAADFLDKQ